MKDTDARTFLERTLLCQCRDNGIPESADKLVEALLAVWLTSADSQVEPIKALRPQRESQQSEECKCDLLREWQHWNGTALLFSQLFDDRGYKLINIANNAVISDFEDGSLGISVNRYDNLTLIHPGEMLDGPGYAYGDVYLWLNGLT